MASRSSTRHRSRAWRGSASSLRRWSCPIVVRPTPERAQQFLDETLRRGHEGVMVKALGAGYAAGRRGQQWLKVKLARTLDLVILAAEWGHGRRTGLAQQSPSRSARSRARRLRDAGEDVQGTDRRDAGVADRQAAFARDQSRPPYRLRAAGAGRRDRVQRGAGKPAVSRRAGAAFREGEELQDRTSQRPTRTRSTQSADIYLRSIDGWMHRDPGSGIGIRDTGSGLRSGSGVRDLGISKIEDRETRGPRTRGRPGIRRLRTEDRRLKTEDGLPQIARGARVRTRS